MIRKGIDTESLKRSFKESQNNYVRIDSLFEEDFIRQCEEDFLKLDESDFFRYSDKYFEFDKFSLSDVEKMPDSLNRLFSYIHSQEFIEFVEKATGIEGLRIDQKRWGGGLHMTKPGGYLSIHKDFNVLPDSYANDAQLLRCVNLIGYLTDEEQSENDGQLEFWKDGNQENAEKVENSFNSWILFDTRDCYHGHPYPFKGKKPRMSIASYYYIEEKVEEEKWSSTDYLKLPWMEESEEYKNRRIERSNPKIRYEKIFNEISQKSK